MNVKESQIDNWFDNRRKKFRISQLQGDMQNYTKPNYQNYEEIENQEMNDSQCSWLNE